ncbi:MAG: ATP-binding protein, partial [Bacteroidota bacterium]|nr:ATP-binding protein [Bacteroidota bacterium]
SPAGNYYEENSMCSKQKVFKYLEKLSKPLLDRIDVQIEVDPVPIKDLTVPCEMNETSEMIKKRVIQARNVQYERQGKTNALLNSTELKKFCELNHKEKHFLIKVGKQINLTARGYGRILKVSRTIADMEGSNSIHMDHILESLQYRSLERIKSFLV